MKLTLWIQNQIENTLIIHDIFLFTFGAGYPKRQAAMGLAQRLRRLTLSYAHFVPFGLVENTNP